jgi:hypothetical protein
LGIGKTTLSRARRNADRRAKYDVTKVLTVAIFVKSIARIIRSLAIEQLRRCPICFISSYSTSSHSSHVQYVLAMSVDDVSVPPQLKTSEPTCCTQTSIRKGLQQATAENID